MTDFIDCINRGDVEGLGALMTDEHTLQVFDELPLVGKAENIEAWWGYASSFPDYVIYPHQMSEDDGRVAVIGHTTGSHLGLPDGEEQNLTVIWEAQVDDGLLASWRIFEDTPRRRRELGLSSGG